MLLKSWVWFQICVSKKMHWKKHIELFSEWEKIKNKTKKIIIEFVQVLC